MAEETLSFRHLSLLELYKVSLFLSLTPSRLKALNLPFTLRLGRRRIDNQSRSHLAP